MQLTLNGYMVELKRSMNKDCAMTSYFMSYQYNNDTTKRVGGGEGGSGGGDSQHS